MEKPMKVEELAALFAKEMRPDGGGRLFAYKETYFTGFAPCFDGDMYSLACCKGNRKTGGLRRSVCKWIEEKDPPQPHSAWILSIAGKDISKKGKTPHNSSGIAYCYGDLISLVRIGDASCITSWERYGKETRKDAIYHLKDGMMVHKGKDYSEEHWEPKSLQETDLGVGMGEGFAKVNQILLSRQYIIFSEHQKLDDRIWDAIQAKRSISEEAIKKAIDEITEHIMPKNVAFCCTSPFGDQSTSSGNSSCGGKGRCRT